MFFPIRMSLSVAARSVLNSMFAQMGEVVGARTQSGESGNWRKPDAVQEHLRDELETSLYRVRDTFKQELTERQTYQLIFPIVVFFDEIIQVRYPEKSWELLQKNLFETDRGGALFYESLDELLDENAPECIYQAYYFCLKLGFEGRLSGNAIKLDSYQERLKTRFALPEAEVQTAPVSAGKVAPTTIRFYWYYLSAAAVIAGFYLLLRTL